ncbi:MAG: hypothetical protein Q9167_001547 [Letrouitia subvulpina]
MRHRLTLWNHYTTARCSFKGYRSASTAYIRSPCLNNSASRSRSIDFARLITSAAIGPPTTALDAKLSRQTCYRSYSSFFNPRTNDASVLSLSEQQPPTSPSRHGLHHQKQPRRESGEQTRTTRLQGTTTTPPIIIDETKKNTNKPARPQTLNQNNPTTPSTEQERPESQKRPPAAKAEDWQIQKAALAAKFEGAGWAPRKRLSPDAMDGIRDLHAQNPELYTTPVLAEQFQISPEAVRRILRSRWKPSEEEQRRRRQRWEKRGQKIWDQLAEQGMKPPKKWRVGARRKKPAVGE